MPVLPLKIAPGIDVESTATLSEGQWNASDKIRFFAGLAQKIGGWVQYTTVIVLGVPRTLHAWQSLALQKFLAVSTAAQVTVILGDQSAGITPVQTFQNAGNFVVTDGSSTANYTDFGAFYAGQIINIGVPVVMGNTGNTVIYGTYAIQHVSAPGVGGTISIGIGAPAVGSSSVFTIPTVTVTAGSTRVVLNGWPGHKLNVGGPFTVYFAIGVGSITIAADNYAVTAILSDSSFAFDSAVPATSNGTTGLFVSGAPIEYFAVSAASSVSTPPALQFPGWSIDNWGEFLMICPYLGTPYVWMPQVGGPAQLIATGTAAGASPINIGLFVAMPEQILVTYGSATPDGAHPPNWTWNPLLVRWSDVSDYTAWFPTSTNQAGSFVIPNGSVIVRGLQAPQQALFWTDIELWSMQYIGPPLVFGFNRIEQNCGLIAPQAVTVMNGCIVWMGPNQFYILNGGGVQVLPCSVWDRVFQNLNRDLVGKICAMPNSYFNEVGWCYPSLASTQENDSYVKVNLTTGVWDYGSLQRSAWIDQSVLGAPIGTDALATVVQHEIGNDAVAAHLDAAHPAQPIKAFIETGYIMIAEGNAFTFIDQFYPDLQFGTPTGSSKGTVMVTIWMVDYPGDAPRQYGPYPVDSQTQYIPLRARGRQMKVRFSSDDLGLFWRIGLMRYRGAPAGRR